METLWQDIRYGSRMVARNPGFATLVVVILAVGIAANTALFSVVNAVLLRPLPYRDSHRLVTLWEKDVRMDDGFRARVHFPFLRENNEVFEAVAGWCHRVFYVEGIETPHETRGYEVTANLFPVLGVQPLLGRGFLPQDETPAGRHVVILSHKFWQEHMGGTRDVLGKQITLTTDVSNGNEDTILQRESYTIVGVMPAGFSFPFRRAAPLWRPLVLSEVNEGMMSRFIFPLARLKKGVTPEQADANLGVLAGQLRQIAPKAKVEAGKVGVTRLLDGMVKGHRRLPLLLLGAAGFVLLIACGNAANLFLARATVRHREVAMRVALGASRRRVLRQMLTESLLLSLGAGVLGLLLTVGTIKTLVRLCPSDIPRLQETSIDLTVLGFTLGVSVLTGLLFGILPAWRVSDVSVSETLKEGAGRTTTGRRWRRLHSGLVVSQLGLSLILLIGATLLIRSLLSLTSVDLGFRPDHVLATHIILPTAKYTQQSQYDGFFQSLLDRLRTLPGVDSAAALFQGTEVGEALGSMEFFNMDFTVAGQADSTQIHSARFMLVTPDYFATMGIPFLRGQTVTDQGPDNVVIDKTFARQCFGDADPIGRTLLFHGSGDWPVRVIGVVDTVRSFDTPEPGRGVVYGRGRGFIRFAVVLVRTAGDPVNLAPAVRQQVRELEEDQVIEAMEPLRTTLSRMVAPRRFVMLLLSAFAGIALALATVGVYGLLQYSTAQQTHDIGIRMALGARKADILRAVVGQGLKLALFGVATGLIGALLLTKVISSFLYGVTRTDPLTFVCVSLALAGAALLASYVPARRAARVDPMEALRYE
ncbi:MAG: ABC transporter permease [Sedimentisphaerales bacterium]|nr:ABC transporter permease [Sedimentisphaerales bacterium]